jgi:hypothetical protein
MVEASNPVNNARKTRGRPFQKGNPGRPVGLRNKRTLLAEQILGADLEAIARAVSTAAQNGDMQAAKIILDRLAPIRRGRPVRFEMPATLDAAGIAEAFATVLRSMAEGELTPEEGTAQRRLRPAWRPWRTSFARGRTVRAAIDRRLRKLELRLHAAPDQNAPGGPFSVVRFQACLLAAHFGEYREGEPVVAAYARALEYGSFSEFKREIQSHAAALAERHNVVFARLLQEHGLDREAGGELKTCEVLFAKVPQALRDYSVFSPRPTHCSRRGARASDPPRRGAQSLFWGGKSSWRRPTAIRSRTFAPSEISSSAKWTRLIDS